ncbi:PEP/pyruvate-binding domain-containing protein [Nocardia sp. NPDC050793]|uniref:PEP/pyruvate-binding domain-containing protein n=1 Tax=Nocardia sp. NPDC050793 TaxID=3155159 RepID=UPI0033FB035E
MQVLGSWDERARIAALAGGKARGLHTVQNGGFRVPDWVALGTDAFERFLAEHELAERVSAIGAADDLERALALGADLRAAIGSAPLPPDLRELIADGYARIGGGPVAVRSSTVVEDGAEHSYAGQFDSFLNVNGVAAVADRVRDCWASAFSERSIRYAFARSRPVGGAPGVVLQRLVSARASGVLFTANPSTGAPGELLISAVYGLGEGLVSGAVDADTVTVEKATGAVLDMIVGDKDSSYTPAAEQGCEIGEVAAALRERAVLTDAEIAELTELGRKIEIVCGAPQDIEWALDDMGLWVLQSRPITTVPANAPDAQLRGAGETLAPGELRIWDNSNIIESFSGITSPLTYTTAAGIYGRVYRGYAASLRVPPAQLRQTDAWTPVLLGYFHGRVYYNLLHWYRMVGIAPGYPLNRRVLEAALGVAEPLADDLAKTLRPFTFRNPLARLRSRAVTTATYLRRLFGIDAMVEDFLAEFYRVYDEYDGLDYASLSGAEVYAAYRRVDRDLVERWGPLMVLDAILLTCTGLLYALTKALLPKAPEWFRYAVVGPGADVESAEPARAMTALARSVDADPELTALVRSTPPDRMFAALADHPDFRAEVDAYLDRYGYRSLDELKLETPDLREDPSGLFIMLRSALGRVHEAAAPPDRRDEATAPSDRRDEATAPPDRRDEATAPPDRRDEATAPLDRRDEATAPLDRRDEAEAYLDAHLRGARRRVYERLRGKVSRCAAHRERLRFCRTRAFGMVKRMIRAMGRDLVERGVIDEFADVFYLTVDELRGCYEGADTGTLRALVAARKAQRAADAELVAPARFVTRGGAFGRAELAAQGWVPVREMPAATVGTVLGGTPSAAGIVEGEAVVVGEPSDVAGGILVAYRTDPGWVAALPSASALVIERGSPLTHVAIVARELGVPTVVQVKDVTKRIRTSMRIRVDGTAGTVTVLSEGDRRDGT